MTRHEALLDRLLGALTADSFDRLLAEGAAALAALADGPCAAAFLIEANRVLAEGWHPAAPDEGSPLAPTFRSLALESVLQGRPVVLPAEPDSAGPARVLLLSAGGRTLGAACVREGGDGSARAPVETLERAARLVAEAIDARRRRESERAVARQQERWFHQLDRQVRVLDRERQKFAAVTNQGDTYVFVTDAAGAIRWVNRAMNDRWPPGDAETGWVGRACHDVCSRFGPDRSTDHCRSCPVTRAIEQNAAVHHELREVSGQRVSTLYLSALPIKGLDGRPQEVLVMIQDLTDLETLRDSEERYRVVTQGASDGIVTVDERGRIVFANDAIERIFGWSPAELMGQQLTRLMAPEYAARHRVSFERDSHSGHRNIPSSGIQLPGRHRDGHEIQLEMTFGESTRDGRRLVTGVMRDVTERKRAERALHEAQERLRMVVSHSPIVLFAIDTQGVFTLSEGRGLTTLGHVPGASVGRSAFEMYADAPHILANLKRALAGEEFTAEVEVGGVVFETRHTPVRDADGTITGVIGVATDVTERRQLEAQLRQSQKMEAVGRLAGGVAHDFNNLLTTILGYATLLIRRAPAGQDPDPRLFEIQRAAERGAGLTRQLLAFSRKQVVEPRVSDLNQLIAEMSDMLRRLIGEDVELTVIPFQESAPIHADRGQLEQVLMNLVVNARDAMPQGGRLTIQISHLTLESALVRGEQSVPAGPWVTLEVRDTGVGMDKETLSRIFEPFFTRKEQGRGTGLGLAMVYGIIEQSGGHIHASSEPGAGSCFTLYLPRAASDPASSEETGPAEAFQAGCETVLLVEDEPPLRALAREMLECEGYRVLVAGGGPEALEVAAGFSGPIHLLVTDVVMPGMSGGTLAQRIRETHPESRVLFMSGYTEDAIVRYGVVRSESALLAKPFTQGTFVARVREVLDRAEPPRDADPRRAA